jgi:tetratricopeptide (TPR) repeat protein
MERKKLMVILSAVVFLGASTSLTYHITQQADINYYQGYRAFLKGQYKKAIPFYERAVRKGAKSQEVYKELAYSYLWTGRSKDSIRLFKDLILKEPGDSEMAYSLAQAYAWNEQYDKAIELLKGVLVERGSDKARKTLAEIYLWSGRPGQARIILEPLAQRYTEDTDIKLLWGKTLYYTGDSERASKIFEEMLQEE